MHLNAIMDKWKAGGYKVKDDSPLVPLPVDYVFDENMSVKRNRQLVEEFNKNITLQRKERRLEESRLFNKLRLDVVQYITETYDIDEKQASIIERFAYDERHSNMYDYFSYIDLMAGFADDLLNCEE